MHLMPLYLSPEGNSDGGYAISDYRTVSPNLGTNKDLKDLAAALHKKGIRMVLDFVFNHTSDEHRWADAAKSGDKEYQEYYYFMGEQDAMEYNQTVREIFPQIRRGSFTYLPELDRHVWTTFNSFQWDLNYSNPAVFVAVVEEMLHLILNGCDVLRLDALAFVWKEKGTVCENLPKAHNLIKAFKACLDIAAPQVVFKSRSHSSPRRSEQIHWCRRMHPVLQPLDDGIIVGKPSDTSNQLALSVPRAQLQDPSTRLGLTTFAVTTTLAGCGTTRSQTVLVSMASAIVAS